MGVEPEEEFVSDNELKSLLERWVAPGPSRVLDKRIETSFVREFSGADGLSQSVLLPHRREEVVSMKFCSVCKEEFADKFSFCPVDGTPLATIAPPVEDPSMTVNRDPSVTISRDTVAEPAAAFTSEPVESDPAWIASRNTSSVLALRDEYHLTIMDDSGLVARLRHELKDVSHDYELTWPEFKRDPFGFTKRAIVGYGQKLREFLGKPNVLVAMGAAVLGIVALVGAVMLMDRSQGATSSRVGLIIFAIVAGGLLVALFSTWLGRERGAAVMGAEPSDSRSVVAAMVSSFVFLFAILGIIVGIDYRNKQKELLAQTEPELQVEQMIDIPDEQPTPDPGNAGLNKGNGIGTGTGGGIGPGEGGGLGPGRGGNIGGGDRNDGGGGPGGGGGGDYSRTFTGKEVTTKARLISKPEPQYTEDARKNQITGTVVLKVVFASNGSVQNIRTVSGLPHGLTERAIAAARQIKFVPATKDGHQVSMWMQLEYNFNLY